MRALAALALLAAACNSPGAGTLRGVVVLDGETDHSGVTVQAAGAASASTLTDASGAWQLRLPPGVYAVVFTADATRERTQAAKVTVATEGTMAPEIHFTPVGTVTGSVLAAGGAAAGASVFVDGVDALGACDEGGRYRIDGVPTGERTIEAVLAGYRPGAQSGVVLRRGQVIEAPPIDLTVDTDPTLPAAALAGTARRIDRSDHAGTTVVATLGDLRFTTVTASDGSYRLDGIPTGVYTLHFTYDGHEEVIPQVLALAGSTGQVVDGALYPLESNPLKLPIARRLVSGPAPIKIFDGERLIAGRRGLPSRTDEELLSISLSTGAATSLATDVNFTSAVVFSDDGQKAIYLAGVDHFQGALRLVGLDGSAPLTLADLAADHDYRFVPDGSAVLYETNSELRIVPVTGGASRLIAASLSQYELHPDGKRVLYQSCDAGTCDLRIQPLDGGAATQLIAAQGSLTVAPNGSRVALVTSLDSSAGTARVQVASADGGGATTLWEGKLYGNAVFSPDGRYLAFITDSSSGGGDLRLADLAGTAPATVLVHAATGVFFTPDGSRLLYYTDPPSDSLIWPPTYHLKQQPVGGGAEVVLGTRVTYSTDLSPDGKQVAFLDLLDYATTTGTLSVAGPTGMPFRPAAQVYSFHFTPDGAHLLFDAADPTDDTAHDLWSVPAAGGAPVQLGGKIVQWSYSASPKGSRAAWSGDDQIVRVAPIGGGTPAAIGLGGITWANDARVVLYQNGTPPPYRHQDGIYLWEAAP
jgi:hypothetical protein